MAANGVNQLVPATLTAMSVDHSTCHVNSAISDATSEPLTLGRHANTARSMPL